MNDTGLSGPAAGRLAALAPGLDLLGLPACVLDGELRYRYANDAYLQEYGKAREDVLGRTPDDAFRHFPTDGRREQLVRALAGETLAYNRRTIEGPNRGRWVRAHYVPLRDGSEVWGVLVVLVDIQPLKDAEAVLEEREQQLSLITDSVGFPVTYVDRDRVVRFVNRSAAQWSSLAPAAMVGRHVDDLMPADVAAAATPLMARALAGEEVAFEREALWPGRESRHIRGHMVPDRDEAGAVRGILIVLIDIEEDWRLRTALEDQRKRLQLVLDNVGVPMSYVDRDQRLRFANQLAPDWRAATLEEAIGRTLAELLQPEVYAVVAPEIEAALRGERRVYERLAERPGGERRWVRVVIVPDRGPEGEVRGVYSMLLDVDEDHRMREALERQEARLRYFAENIPGPIAVVDAQFRYVFANKVFQRLRGVGLDEIVGRSVREVLGPEISRDYFDPFVERLMRGETCTYERLVGPPGGEQRWHLVRLVPILDAGDGFNGYYIVGSDIHDIKLGEERLRMQQAQLRLFADNIPDAVAYLDRDRRILFANRQFALLRGLTTEEVVGKTTAQALGPEVAEWIAQRTQKVLDRGEVVTYERLTDLPDDGQRWMHVKVVPHFGEAGRVLGMYVVAHDIHDVKEAQAELEDKERQLRQVIDSVPTPMCYVDAEERYRYVNNAFLDYIGLEAAQIVGRPVVDVLGAERFRQLHPHLQRLKKGDVLAVERLVRFADGSARWMIVRLTPRISEGRYLGYYATTSDIHEQKLIEEELRRANSILSAHFDNTPLAVIEWDTELRIVRWSGQAESIFGWDAVEALGRPLEGWRLVYEDDRDAVAKLIGDLVDGAGRHATLLNRNYRKDGSVIWVEWHYSALRDEAGHLVSILSLAQDVSSRIQAEERLQYMATHDGLTGLPNSVLLNDRLDAALARARRSQGRVGVMFLDLDHFKDVNDTLGHRVGDLLLKELARRIRGALRQSDVLARVSGDEFVVVMEDFPDETAPELVARKVLDEVCRPFHVEGHEIQVSGSLGLALHPEDGADAETLLKNADAAMYHAKELGRNGFRLFSAELAERRSQRLQVETALRRALRSDELALHYQPIVDLGTGIVHGAEALLRWQDPERGLVLPHGFVPLAEESGLGHAVGHWVLEAACRQARAWREGGLGAINVSVNLSAGQLRDTAMIADLKNVLRETGCEPGWIQLEITETSMVRDVEGVSVVLGKLRALGVRVAIDDFGTGFSSLSHLRHLPVDTLKIDKAFVADIGAAPARGRSRRGDNAGGAAIVSAVIGLARGLGLGVIAEGVEKRPQLDFLARAGCDACQGYLLCPPLAAPDFEQWIRARAKPPAKRKPGARAIYVREARRRK
ncbi:MAG TPA: PAS domain-containing protein [Usitatibacter sp.]|nr:PAS domain-containing protein [Usitatibacter sp.]